MDDSSTYELIDVHLHTRGTKIDYTQEKIDAVKSYMLRTKNATKFEKV